MRTRARQIVCALASVTVLVSAGGCSIIGNSPAATADSGQAPADGVVLQVGDVKASNLLIVAVDGDAPGRLLGNLFNNSDEPTTVTIETDADKARIPVPAGSTVMLEEIDPVILDPAGADPGLMVEARISAAGQSTVKSVPVLDHTFPRYAEFVPGGVPATPAGPSTTPTAGEGQVDEGGGEEERAEPAAQPTAPYTGPYDAVFGANPEAYAEQEVTLTGKLGTVISPVAFTMTEPQDPEAAPLLVINFDETSADLQNGAPVEVIGTVHEAYNVPDTEENLGDSPGPKVLAAYDGRPYLEAHLVRRQDRADTTSPG